MPAGEVATFGEVEVQLAEEGSLRSTHERTFQHQGHGDAVYEALVPMLQFLAAVRPVRQFPAAFPPSAQFSLELTPTLPPVEQNAPWPFAISPRGRRTGAS